MNWSKIFPKFIPYSCLEMSPKWQSGVCKREGDGFSEFDNFWDVNYLKWVGTFSEKGDYGTPKLFLPYNYLRKGKEKLILKHDSN